MMKSKVFYCISLGFPLASFSQEGSESNEKYTQEENNKISIVGGFSYINNSFGLHYNCKTFLLKPNDSFYTEFFLRYSWLDVTFSFTPKLIKINNDDDIKGKTKYLNIEFAFFLNPKLRQFVSYNQIKGFYLESTKELFNILFEGEDYMEFSNAYLQFPDIKYRSFKGETSYLWAENKEDYKSYDNGKWFFGGGAQLNRINNSDENFYSVTQWQYRMEAGLRINSPKFVNKNFDKAERILNKF